MECHLGVLKKQASGVAGSCSHGQCMASHKVSRVLLQIPTMHACFPNIVMENPTVYQEKHGRFSMAMLVYRRVIFLYFFEMLKHNINSGSKMVAQIVRMFFSLRFVYVFCFLFGVRHAYINLFQEQMDAVYFLLS